MQRAAKILAAANLALILAILEIQGVSQDELRLFRVSAPERSDRAAIEAWWRDEHGDGGPKLAIAEIRPRKKPADFEIKHDSGHPLGPYWMNLAERLDKFRTTESDPESELYKLRNGSVGASAFTAKLKSDRREWECLFVVTNEGVIYTSRSFKQVR